MSIVFPTNQKFLTFLPRCRYRFQQLLDAKHCSEGIQIEATLALKNFSIWIRILFPTNFSSLPNDLLIFFSRMSSHRVANTIAMSYRLFVISRLFLDIEMLFLFYFFFFRFFLCKFFENCIFLWVFGAIVYCLLLLVACLSETRFQLRCYY